MTNRATTVIRCDDGTEFPLDWVYPGAEDCTWEWNREHRSFPDSPIGRWFDANGTLGADRAWDEAGLVPQPPGYRFQYVGPFQYLTRTPLPPARAEAARAGIERVLQRHGSALGFWQQFCQPRIEAVCADFASTAPGRSMRSIAEAWAYAWRQTMTSGSTAQSLVRRLTELLAESVGSEATLVAYEVTQGGNNASQRIDSEIWQLAVLAGQNPAVKRLLELHRPVEALPALRSEPSAAPFVAAFDALIERHGSRSQGWDILLPTWRERPEAPLALIAAHVASEHVSPIELQARSEGRRARATADALARLPESRHAEFQALVTRLEGYVSIREDRAYWQMTLSGEVRGLLLRQGAALAELGRIEQADDIFFLLPEDFEDGGSSDLSHLASERRAQWEHWCRITPPWFIGAEARSAVAEAAPDVLRGTPASRGQVTGTARILHGAEQAALLGPGEVLVCVMTTPAWTPLFAIAGGVVTETGGPLSHPAITAREYGIPSVVAVRGATERIRDGQLIRVDGAAGSVELLGGA